VDYSEETESHCLMILLA